MKVFFLGRYNTGEILTGPEKVAKRIFGEFTKENESVFIEYFFDGRNHSFWKKLFGKENIQQTKTALILRLGLIRLLFYLLKQKPTTIHIITFERFVVISYLYKLFSKTKIICGFQGIATHENTFYKSVTQYYFLKDKICESIIIKFSDSLVFLSDKSVEIAEQYFKIDKNKMSIFPNGVDRLFHEMGKKKTFEDNNKLQIVFIGDINRKEKGFLFLQSSLEKLRHEFDLHLISNDQQFARRNFHNAPLMNTKELAEFLSDKDVYISSSQYEPFSMAAAEAMCEGLVCIMTRETGVSRYVDNGVNGYLFDYNDSVRLLEILELLNSRRELFPQISGNSKKLYEKLSWPVLAQMYKQLYI